MKRRKGENAAALSDEIRETIARVTRMEALYERLSEAVQKAPERLGDAELRDAADALAAYLDSGGWLRDYEADEAGLLPAELKRGVLSQDGLYDLLSALPPAPEAEDLPEE